MDLHVDLTGPEGLSDGIYRQLLDAVLDGRLRPDSRLPPTRDLARQLAVSRNTVATAYDRLTAEGFLVARVGAGTFVCAELGVPVDDEGLVVSALPAAARLVYTTPSHQLPLGVPMSLRRRGDLLEFAGRRGAVIVEDDYDTEFRFSDRPLSPLQSLDGAGRVIYVGSFSKTLLPTLRLGFLVPPASLLPALRAARQLSDWYGDPVTQRALARFLDGGLFARHVRRAAREYGARRDLVRAGVERELPALRLAPSTAGLHLAALLPPGADVDADAAVARSRAAGIAVRALSWFADGPVAQRGLVLGYGAIPRDRIAPGLAALAAHLR